MVLSNFARSHMNTSTNDAYDTHISTPWHAFCLHKGKDFPVYWQECQRCVVPWAIRSTWCCQHPWLAHIKHAPTHAVCAKTFILRVKLSLMSNSSSEAVSSPTASHDANSHNVWGLQDAFFYYYCWHQLVFVTGDKAMHGLVTRHVYSGWLVHLMTTV